MELKTFLYTKERILFTFNWILLVLVSLTDCYSKNTVK